jgi:gliding motility-associated-like protein
LKTISKILFSYILIFGLNTLAYAQKQNNQWRFGVGGALDFNTLPPSFVAGCPISTTEGSASVADRITGALLFYTDGVTVWNANNQVMPNGTGLLGGVTQMSSTTAAVIVPKPGSSSLFYIVTVDEIPFINGVRYSVVDMTLNGGLGDIVVGQKNIFLMQTTSERLEVVPACDGLSLWLIACSINNEFVSFRIDNTGIQATPITSAVFQNGFAGHMKINRQFNKIAIGCCSQIEVFDFDNATGIVSNPIVWNANLPSGLVWGIEFSPDGKVLYASDGTFLLQFDLTQTTPLAIQNSEYQVASFTNFTLQLGIDERIYVNSGSLSAINFPNNLGIACGYQTNVIANQTGVDLGAAGIPKWVYYANDPPYNIVFNENCFGANTQFFIADTTGISNITWNFGDPNTGANNTAAGDTAFHTFSQLGIYTIQAILTTACGFDTLSTEVAILNPCDSQDEQCDVFEYTGVVQQWTVPAGVDTIRVKMWGGAGGGGPYLGDVGGGGGYTQFELAVTPGESLEISVGQGGKAALGGTGGAGGWPGGGAGGSGNLPTTFSGVTFIIGGGGGGGGATIIRRLTNNTLIAVAGAGGGSAFGRNGGNGGGLEGNFTAFNNEFNQYGFGGTQTAGGNAAQNTLVINSVLGTAGSAFQGGIGATDLNPDNQRKGGGGGGSGYYGGGGGSAYDSFGFGVGSAGGGGSGFLLCTNCPNLSGSLLGPNPLQFDGTPANPSDPLLGSYPETGKGNMGNNGGNGLVQICYTSVPCSPTTAAIIETACSNYTAPWGATYNQTGTYSDTIVNSNGCDSIIQLNLTITGLPIVTAESDSASCGLPNGSATAAATGGSGNYSYTWSNGATGSFVIGLAAGSYSVIATDQNGCTSSTQVSVSSTSASGVSLIANDTFLEYGDSVTLEVLGANTYLWAPPDGLSCTNCPSVIASPLASTVYQVTGVDSSGCGYLLNVKLEVDIELNEIFVPDAFSPNSDGINDKVFVRGSIKEFSFSVFNRWGEVVFRTQNQSTGWDGTFRGKELEVGVFVYYLSGTDAAGNAFNKKGNISLVK